MTNFIYINFFFILQFCAATMSHAKVAWLTFMRTKSGGALEIIRARFYCRCIILGGRASLSRGNEQWKRRTSHFTRLHSRYSKFAKSSRATGSTICPPLISNVENEFVVGTLETYDVKASVGIFNS